MATKTKTRKKREKHVFSCAGEVAHIWAQQCQDDGRNGNGNFYFTGDTIYSYGSHFPIAKFHKMPCGKRVVLFDNRTYSMSTGMHQSCVLGSLRGTEIEIVNMPSRAWFSFDLGKKYLLSEIADAFDLSSRAREYAMSHRRAAFTYIGDLKRWGELNRRKAIYKFTKKDLEIVLRADAQREKLAIRDEKRKVRAEFQQAAAIKELKEVCGGDIHAYWRLHGQLPSGYSVYTHLQDTVCRIVNDEVITSRHARVPVKHVLRLLPIIKRCHDKKKQYTCDNQHPQRIGYYQLQRIEDNGDIVIGCHHIKYAEVELLGQQLLPDLFKKEGG